MHGSYCVCRRRKVLELGDISATGTRSVDCCARAQIHNTNVIWAGQRWDAWRRCQVSLPGVLPVRFLCVTARVVKRSTGEVHFHLKNCFYKPSFMIIAFSCIYICIYSGNMTPVMIVLMQTSWFKISGQCSCSFSVSAKVNTFTIKSFNKLTSKKKRKKQHH